MRCYLWAGLLSQYCCQGCNLRSVGGVADGGVETYYCGAESCRCTEVLGEVGGGGVETVATLVLCRGLGGEAGGAQR